MTKRIAWAYLFAGGIAAACHDLDAFGPTDLDDGGRDASTAVDSSGPMDATLARDAGEDAGEDARADASPLADGGDASSMADGGDANSNAEGGGVSTEAGSPFCASLPKAPLFCDDFDESPDDAGALAATWDGIISSGGTVTRAGGIVRSPPLAMLVSETNPQASSPEVSAYKTFPQTPSPGTSLALSFDVYVVTADTTAVSDAVLATFEIGGGTPALLVLQLEMSANSNGTLGIRLSENAIDSGGGGFLYTSIPTPQSLTVGTWTHVVLRAAEYVDGTELVELDLDGVQAAVTMPSAVFAGSESRIEVGLTSAAQSTQGWVVRYDNVTFDRSMADVDAGATTGGLCDPAPCAVGDGCSGLDEELDGGPGPQICMQLCSPYGGVGNCTGAAVASGTTPEPANVPMCLIDSWGPGTTNLCTVPCNPVLAAGPPGCQPGMACTYGTAPSGAEFTYCDAPGGVSVGGACTGQTTATSCGAGLACVGGESDASAYVCVTVCRNGHNGDCPADGGVCMPSNAPSEMFGFCQ